MPKDNKFDPVTNPREAEKNTDNAPNNDPNVARSEYGPNDSTTASEPETPGGTEKRTSGDEAPKSDGNATRDPGIQKPGDESAPEDLKGKVPTEKKINISTSTSPKK